MIGSWINFISLNVSAILLVYSYILSVMPVTRAETRGEKAWKECVIYRNLNRVIEIVLLLNLIFWTLIPIPGLGWIVHENFIIGLSIGFAILIPTLVIWIKGLRDAGIESFVPREKKKQLNKGIYKYLRHPQTLGGYPLFIAFAFMVNSLFLVFWALIFTLTSVPIIMYYEEKDLVKRFSGYLEYKRTTPAFFPKIDFMWRLFKVFFRFLIPQSVRFPMFSESYFQWVMKHPKIIPTIIRLARATRKTSKIRKEELERGVKVPPFLIISITQSCNLRCAGCYAAATGTMFDSNTKKSLNIDQWLKIISEAKDLGVFGFIIAGGEPFRLKNLKNTVVVVSIEGDQELTNARRGSGVYNKAINTIQRLDHFGIMGGISITINRLNYKYWMEGDNIDDLIAKGVHIGFFLEYIPVCSDTELILTDDQSKEFRRKILEFRKTKRIFLVHSPGDEEYMGGCVSAGRGFAHITPLGDLTPCPVSDIATHNLTRSSLREGLKSPLFKVIRESEHLLETDGSPCALFSHPKEVDEIAKKVQAYRTNE
jgi:MoaA/NifB/PqqE/SkfB family radical SAM enzyme/protein-S-isoprenylcysteine O-methyltransferase Ste14